MPLVQASYEQQIALLPEPSYDGPYDIDQDPVWQHQPQAPAFKALDWYQCDHLGTPLELTDQHGEMVWRADYQAWGQAQVRLSEAAQRRKLDTALRFQGQYLDVETELHYNRYRYYDPQVGRFVSADPIGYAGGLNLYQYAPNAVEWIDPEGLTRQCHTCAPKDQKKEEEREKKKSERQCDEMHDDYNQAMNSALEFTQITAKGSTPNPAKFIPYPYNGRRAPDEHRGFRVEHDDRHKAHINAFDGKKRGRTICFEASPKTVARIIRRFNR